MKESFEVQKKEIRVTLEKQIKAYIEIRERMAEEIQKQQQELNELRKGKEGDDSIWMSRVEALHRTHGEEVEQLKQQYAD